MCMILVENDDFPQIRRAAVSETDTITNHHSRHACAPAALLSPQVRRPAFGLPLSIFRRTKARCKPVYAQLGGIPAVWGSRVAAHRAANNMVSATTGLRRRVCPNRTNRRIGAFRSFDQGSRCGGVRWIIPAGRRRGAGVCAAKAGPARGSLLGSSATRRGPARPRRAAQRAGGGGARQGGLGVLRVVAGLSS